MRKYIDKYFGNKYRKIMKDSACIIGVSTALAEKFRYNKNQPIAQIADTKFIKNDFHEPNMPTKKIWFKSS